MIAQLKFYSPWATVNFYPWYQSLMWYFFICPFPKLCSVTLPYIQDGCHGLWSIEKLEILENLLYHSMEWNQIFFFIKSIFPFAYDLISPGYSWGLHTFNTHITILHIQGMKNYFWSHLPKGKWNKKFTFTSKFLLSRWGPRIRPNLSRRVWNI